MTAGWISSRSSAFSQDERPTPEEQERRQRMWSLLLIAAALLLISESLLSHLRTTVNPGQPLEPPSTVDR
jgi:hypothetical protein